ncbi:MAG: hypothetical protein JTT11_08185 [Candidatus Brockarchaeota archaeon]|nr:hypothetical protein [Candidatus Brockarchaeota archaeon]
MKSLNIRFTEQHIKAMNDLVNAKLYGSVADVIRAAVRDLLLREYFGREETIQNLILAHGGSEKNTYGLGDRAKVHRGPKRGKKAQTQTTTTTAAEAEAEVQGDTIAVGTSRSPEPLAAGKAVAVDREKEGP